MRKKIDPETYLRILNDYGSFLEKNSGYSFYDIKLLPHQKDSILSAIMYFIRTAHDEEMINVLTTAAMALSSFQDDVGETMISPWTDIEIESMDARELAALVLKFDNEKFQKLSAIQREEDEGTLCRIERAKSLNRNLNPYEPERPKGFWRRLFG